MARNTTVYSQNGAITFRRSSHSFKIDLLNNIKIGTNLQNLEKEARKMYVSDGFKPELYEKCLQYLITKDLSVFTDEERATLRIFCQVDQAGAEALIVAYLCRNGNFRSLFLNDVKPHVFVALHLFSQRWQQELNKFSKDITVDINDALGTPIPELKNLPYWKELDKTIKSSDNWPSYERYYYIAKQVCHSSNYGIRPSAFQLNTLEKSRGKIVLSKKQAEDYLLFYHSLFPEIQDWHRQVQRQLETTRIIYNLFGYPRIFTGFINETMLKDAYAHCPQSTVACITAKAYCRLQEYIEESGVLWDLLADTHDSYMVQCPIGEEDACKSVMQKFMNQELVSPNGEHFFMRSEAVSGFNWSPYKKIKNELGLR